MRTLILGDIHSNLEALQAVLQDAETHGGFHQTWCLGDTVGYGPDPGPCLDLLRQCASLTVAGNHDHGSTGLLDLETFNPNAASACRWTAQNLSPEHCAYLKGLPLIASEAPFTLVHGSLRDPLWEYLVNAEAASATFQLLHTPCCLVSHSHVSFLCARSPRGAAFRRPPENQQVSLGNQPLILNPGSVGQPRDGDPRASYILYDDATQSVVFYRVAYDIPTTQKKMAAAGLPQPLIDRLSLGR